MVNTNNNNNNGGNMNKDKKTFTNWNKIYMTVPMWVDEELDGEDIEETIEKNGSVAVDTTVYDNPIKK